MKKKIIILCTGNSCRSQMAEGWFKYFYPELDVHSAGTHPEPVNKYSVEVMKEVNIDISKNTSNNVSEFSNDFFDILLTVCDNATKICPNFDNCKVKTHFSFKDPAKAKGTKHTKLSVYRKVRDEIKVYVKHFFD